MGGIIHTCWSFNQVTELLSPPLTTFYGQATLQGQDTELRGVFQILRQLEMVAEPEERLSLLSTTTSWSSSICEVLYGLQNDFYTVWRLPLLSNLYYWDVTQPVCSYGEHLPSSTWLAGLSFPIISLVLLWEDVQFTSGRCQGTHGEHWGIQALDSALLTTWSASVRWTHCWPLWRACPVLQTKQDNNAWSENSSGHRNRQALKWLWNTGWELGQ